MSSQAISVCTIHIQVVFLGLYMQPYHTVENVYNVYYIFVCTTCIVYPQHICTWTIELIEYRCHIQYTYYVEIKRQNSLSTLYLCITHVMMYPFHFIIAFQHAIFYPINEVHFLAAEPRAQLRNHEMVVLGTAHPGK